jgi:DNA repair protein RadD
MRPLYEHQSRAIDMLRQSLGSGHKRPMLQAPTGFGKTMLATAIVEGALRKGKRVIFCVPALSLIDQTVEAFWNEGIRDIGVIQGDHEMTNRARPVQVASVQTLQKRVIPPADIVVVDEAHKMFEFIKKWMKDPEWRSIPFVGLSASPWSRGLGKFYDDLIIAATTQQLIDTGFLSKFRVFVPSHPDLSEVRTVAGDYHEGDLAEAMGKPHLIADVVNTWLEKGEQRSTLCFAVDRAHAKLLEQQFASRGVRTAYIDAYTEREERKEIGARFHEGDVKVVCNVGCLTTGIDWDVRCIILARPTKSEMLFTQIIGRGLRTAEGKEDCLVLDHSDTHLNLGFVTDIHHAKLDEGKASPAKIVKPKKNEPKECQRCHFLKAPKVHICPSCGYAPVIKPNVECVDGDLVELDGRKRQELKISSEQKASIYAQLKGYALQRGYAEGWASHKFKERTGVWPDRYKDVAPVEPSPEMRNWIKSRAIAFAKAREKQGGRNDRAA